MAKKAEKRCCASVESKGRKRQCKNKALEGKHFCKSHYGKGYYKWY